MEEYQPNQIKLKPKIVRKENRESEKIEEEEEEDEDGSNEIKPIIKKEKVVIPKSLMEIKISQKMMFSSLMKSGDKDDLLDRANRVLSSGGWDDMEDTKKENNKSKKPSLDFNMKKLSKDNLLFDDKKKKPSKEAILGSPRIDSPKRTKKEDLKDKMIERSKERKPSIVDKLKMIEKEKIGDKEKIVEIKNLFQDNQVKFVKKMLEEKQKMNFLTLNNYSTNTTSPIRSNNSKTTSVDTMDEEKTTLERESEGIYSLISPRQTRNQYRNMKMSEHGLNQGKKGTKKMPQLNPKDFLNSLNCRVFGVPLELMMEKGEVPPILIQMMERLKAEGLFENKKCLLIPSKSADTKEMMRICKKIEDIEFNVNQDCKDPSLIPNLLHKFLNDLPAPLLTNEYKQWFVVLEKKIKSPQTRVKALHSLINCLPKRNKTLLQFFLSYLVQCKPIQQLNKDVLRRVCRYFAFAIFHPVSPKDDLPLLSFYHFLVHFHLLFENKWTQIQFFNSGSVQSEGDSMVISGKSNTVKLLF